MAMDDATRIKPRSSGYILRSLKNQEEHSLEGEMIVGREVECAIAIRSGHISRYHAKINVMRSGVYIEDLHSTNGTFVNGKRIKGRVRLSLGDEVTFDDVAYRVTSTQSGDQEQTMLSPRHGAKDVDEVPANQPQPSNVEPFPSSVPKPAAQKAASQNKSDDIPAHADYTPPIQQAEPEPVSESQPQESEAPGTDNTRILSGTQLEQYVERNRATHREVSVGEGPRLIIMTAPLRGKCFQIEDDVLATHWQIGRSPDSDIRLTDKTISSDHARITQLTEGFEIKATHAKNGIIINGIPKTRAELQHDDVIQIGSTELVFKTDYPVQQPIAPEEVDLVDKGQSLRHTFIGAAVILVVLVTVMIASKR